MKKTLKSPSLPTLQKLAPLWRYRIVLFIVLIAGLCGYLLLQINASFTMLPTESPQITAARKSPRIDPALVQQLQNLQDNSVNVQALFNEARENPFQ